MSLAHKELRMSYILIDFVPLMTVQQDIRDVWGISDTVDNFENTEQKLKIGDDWRSRAI